MSPKTIIFIGRSGCGKGTQAMLIQEYLKKNDTENRHIYYQETGAVFREFINGSSHSSRLSKEIYERDDRQPDYLAIWMWSNRFIQDLTGEEHVIVDGTPRSMFEAGVLENALEFYKRHALVVFLNISREEAVRRLVKRGQEKYGRADDSNVSKINKRLDWFDKDVMPAIDYLRDKKTLDFVEINGELPIEKVHIEIMKALR